MKNLILIFALALASTVNAQRVVQYDIDIANFHYQDYTFAAGYKSWIGLIKFDLNV